MLLRIDLQDGFEGDTVRLLLDGNLLCEYHQVQTDLRIGLALSHELNLPEGSYTLTVEIPNRGLSTVIPLTLQTDTYLRVWVEHGSVLHEVSSEPYYYL